MGRWQRRNVDRDTGGREAAEISLDEKRAKKLMKQDIVDSGTSIIIF